MRDPFAVAQRAAVIEPSPTLAITAEAKALKAKGVDVIGFGAGEPDFHTPKHICDAAHAAIDDGHHRYTPAAGTPALRKAFGDWVEGSQGTAYEPSQVIVTTGGKYAVYSLMQCTLEPGDEVVLAAPYWVSYVDMIRTCGAIPVVLQTKDTGFKLQPDALRAALTDKTRLVLFNSPSNPSGVGYTADELRPLVETALEHSDALLISDELYEHLVYDGFEHKAVASLSDEAYARTMLIHGVSKSYAMTGWRIGFCAGDARIIAAMSRLQGASTSNPNAIAQVAAVAALTGTQEPVAKMREAFARRRTRVLELLRDIPDVSVPTPNGAFYVFPDVSAYIGKAAGDSVIEGSEDLARYLLREKDIAVVHGTAFGCEGHLRLSYALSDEDLEKGLARLREGLLALQ